MKPQVIRQVFSAERHSGEQMRVERTIEFANASIWLTASTGLNNALRVGSLQSNHKLNSENLAANVSCLRFGACFARGYSDM